MHVQPVRLIILDGVHTILLNSKHELVYARPRIGASFRKQASTLFAVAIKSDRLKAFNVVAGVVIVHCNTHLIYS